MRLRPASLKTVPRVLSNKIASQVEIHARYGGVVPEVASRQHMLAIIPIIKQAMEEAKAGWKDLDAIAVTKGPGLAGSLLVGVNTAKAIALAKKNTSYRSQSSGRPYLCQLADRPEYLLPGYLPDRFRRAQRSGFDERPRRIYPAGANAG